MVITLIYFIYHINLIVYLKRCLNVYMLNLFYLQQLRVSQQLNLPMHIFHFFNFNFFELPSILNTLLVLLISQMHFQIFDPCNNMYQQPITYLIYHISLICIFIYHNDPQKSHSLLNYNELYLTKNMFIPFLYEHQFYKSFLIAISFSLNTHSLQ